MMLCMITHLGVSNVQVAVGFRGESRDHLAPCTSQVLRQYCRAVGDPQQAAVTPTDSGVHLRGEKRQQQQQQQQQQEEEEVIDEV